MKKFSPSIYIGLLIFCLISCENAPNNTTDNSTPIETEQSPIPAIFQKTLAAHGGLEQWSKMESLAYSFPKKDTMERQIIDLKSRKVRIEHRDYSVGFDGEEVWVAPNKEAFGTSSARFYHNLIFYFYAMPFVLADPGIKYEVLDAKEIGGEKYDAVKISYHDGVGDAPEDYYIALLDQESHKMEYLMYTVTYFQGAVNEKFKILKYSEWSKSNGLLLPKVMQGYKLEDGQLGDKRYDRVFSDISIGEKPLESSIFERPDQYEIDSLLKH